MSAERKSIVSALVPRMLQFILGSSPLKEKTPQCKIFVSNKVTTLHLGAADLCRSSALLLGNPELKRNILCSKYGREALAVFPH